MKSQVQPNLIQVFTASRQRERELVGNRATEWLRDNPGVEVVDWVVTQSSDREYHCLSITLFCRAGDPDAA